MAKTKLAVLFGGRSCEHDVSIVTALQAMHAVDTEAYEVIPVYIARDGSWYTGDRLRDIAFMRSFRPEAEGVLRVYPDATAGSGALLTIERKKGLFKGGDALEVAARMDVALLAFHGTHGEDGAVQGLLELMNVPYTASGLTGSAVGMDKIAMRLLFRGCGYPVLDFAWFSREEWTQNADACIDRVEAVQPYPMFVKPANLGSSIGISRAEDRAALREAVAVALSFDRRVMVERAIDGPREVNCSVLGFDTEVQASVCEMPLSWEEFLTFDEKYLRGGKMGATKGIPEAKGGQSGGMASLGRQIPAPIGEALTGRIQALSRDIFRMLDCKGVVRIDYMLEGDALYVGEINTIPGSLAFYLWEATGLPYAQLIDRLVACAQRAHAAKNESVFAYDSTILQNAGTGIKSRG